MANKPIAENIIYRGHRYGRYHTGFDDKASAMRVQDKLKRQGEASVIKKYDWKSGAANKAHYVFYILYVSGRHP